jgi:uncharacterized protein
MQIGRVNKLPVMGVGELGVLVGNRQHHILLRPGNAPAGVKKGDRLDVFVYSDGAGNLLGSTSIPAGEAGDFVLLQVVDVSDPGAFMDWGLEKDLLIPRSEQHGPMRPGQDVVVAIAIDPRTERCFGSTMLSRYLDFEPRLRPGEVVDFLVYRTIDAGALGVINNAYSGMVAKADLPRRPAIGDEMSVYVRRIHEDGRVDCSPRPGGELGRDEDEGVVLDALEANGGRLALTDKSAPELIRKQLGLSKKAFKRSIGSLYRRRVVRITDTGVELLKN